MATITVFLPGKSHGQRSLAGYTPWGHKELEMTERLTDTHTVLILPARNARDLFKPYNQTAAVVKMWLTVGINQIWDWLPLTQTQGSA